MLGAVPQSPKSDLPGDRTMQSSSPKMSKKTTGGKALSKARVSAAIAFVRARNAKSPSHNENGMSQTSPRVGNSDTGTPRLPLTPSRMNSTLRANQAEGPEKPFFVSGEPQSIATKDNDVSVLSPPSSLGASSPCGRRSRRLAAAKYAETKSFASSPRRGLPPSPKFQEKSESTSAKQHDDNLDDTSLSSSEDSLDQKVVSDLADFIDALNKSSSSTGSDSVDRVEARSDNASSVASRELDASVLQSLGDFIDRLHHQKETACDANDAIQVTSSSSFSDDEAEVDPETLKQIASYIDTVTMAKSAFSPSSRSEKASAGGAASVSMDPIEPSRTTTNGNVYEDDAIDIGYSESTEESPSAESAGGRIEDTASIKEGEAVELCSTKETETEISVSPTEANQGGKEGLKGDIFDGYDSDRFTEIGGETIEIGADSSSFDEIEANRDRLSDEGNNDTVSTSKLLERALKAAHVAVQREQSSKPEIVDERDEQIVEVVASRSLEDIVECVQSISRSESSLTKVENDSLDSNEHVENISVSIEVDKSPSPQEELLNISKQTAYDAITASRSRDEYSNSVQGIHDTNPLIDSPSKSGSEDFQVESVEESECSESISKVMASLDLSESDETLGNNDEARTIKIVTSSRVASGNNVLQQKKHGLESKQSVESETGSKGDQDRGGNVSSEMASLDFSKSNETVGRSGDLSELGIEQVSGLGNVSNPKYIDVVSQAPSHDSKFSTGGSAESDSLSKAMASLDLSGSGDTTERNAELSGLGIEHTATADTATNVSSRFETIEETACESRQRETIGLGTPSDIGNVSNAKYVDIVSEAPSHDSKSSTGGSAESDSLSKIMASFDLSGSGDITERNAELSGLGIGEHIVTADTTANMSNKIETPEETTRESKQSVWNDAETIGSESFMNAMAFLDKGESDESAEKDSAASGCDVERAKTILSSVRRPEMEAGDGLDRDLTAPVEAVVEDPRSSELREDTSTSEWTEEEVLTSSWDEAVEITIGTSSHDNTLVVKKSTSKASASLGLSVSDGNNDVANSGAKTEEVISVERNESKDAVDSGSVHEECAKDIRTEDLFTSAEISSFLSTEKGDDHPMVTAASTSSPEAPTPEDRDNFLIESVLNALESDERTENMQAVRRAPSDDRESYLFNAFLAGSDTEISVDPIIRNYSTTDSIDEDDNIAKFQERTALRTATLSSSDARSEDSDKLTEINGDIIEISKDVVVDDGINLASASVAKVTEIITHVSESDSESTVVKTSEAGEIESPESYLFNAFLLASASDISVDPILLDPSTMKSVHEDDNIERFLAKTFTLPEGSTKQELLMLNTFIKEATDLIQNGGTVEQRQNLVKAAIRDGLPKDMVEEVIVSLVCESSKDEGKETPPPPPSPTPPLPAPSKVDDRSRQFLSITHCYIQKVYETSDTVNDESNEAPETDLSPEPPIPEPVSTSSSLKQELDNILSDTCEMNSMDEEDEGPAEEASVEKMGVMDTFIQKLAPREGASANEIELLSQFMKLAAPVMSGNRLSKDEEMKLRSTAAGVGISEKLLDELLRDTVSEKQEQPAPPGIVSEADGDPSESIANFRGSVVAGPNEISSSIGVDVEADADAVEVSMDMSYAEMKEMLIEDIEGEDHKHEECKSNDHINEDKNGDTSEETCATRKLTVKTDSGTADIAFENKVWSPIEDAGGERYAMPATPLSQMETPRITSTNGTSFEGMDTLLSPRSRLPLHRSRYSPSSKALVTPSKLGGSAAAAVISRWAPRRAGRKRLPIKQHWRLSYRERTKNHPGYFEVDVFSLMDMSVSVAAPHRLDDVPWEDREVKQRFLYEQSVSFSRNWFGVMPRRRGNDKYREPVARPDSMAMPMSHRQEQDWPNEWYSSWQSRKLFGEEEHDDGSSTSSFSSTSSRSSGERTGSILSGSVLSGSVLTRGTRDSGDSLDDYESDCESTWDYDDDGPECGHIVNVKQKIGERVSRVNPYTTSSLRRSRWRRKYFPRGTFPY